MVNFHIVYLIERYARKCIQELHLLFFRWNCERVISYLLNAFEMGLIMLNIQFAIRLLYLGKIVVKMGILLLYSLVRSLRGRVCCVAIY